MRDAVGVAWAVRSVLFVHQSAEMYGSDRVLLGVASYLHSSGRFRVIVVLPCVGPLKSALEDEGVIVLVGPVAKISRSAFSLGGVINLTKEVFRAFSFLCEVIRRFEVQLVHSNTVAVLGGALAAKVCGVPHVWHVHEIVDRPSVVRRILPVLVSAFSDRVIGISGMVACWLKEAAPSVENKLDVIWNGLPERPPTLPTMVDEFRRKVGVEAGVPLLAVVGRLSRRKGQLVVVAAATVLWERGVRNFRVVFVGSPPPGETVRLFELKQGIAESPCKHLFTVHDFVSDVWTVWDACDIAIVPSVEPEGFGLVAVEAMAAGKPVVATAVGGLVEIVDSEVSGVFVNPGDAVALASALERLIKDPLLCHRLGANGLSRQRALFSIDRQLEGVQQCYERAFVQARARTFR